MDWEPPVSIADFAKLRYSLLLKLETINSEIEKADSPPSQSNFERLRDSLLKVFERREDPQYGSEIFCSHREANSFFRRLRDSLFSPLETISEVDSPLSQLIFEGLQLCRRFLHMDAIGLQLWISWFRPHQAEATKLYLYFSHSTGKIAYTLYEIELPNPIYYPPTKADQDAEIRNPSQLQPILELETSKYPDGMCCVQLGFGLYFFGGKFSTRNVLPQDVYVFHIALYNKCPHLLRRMDKDMLLRRAPMNSGKASPLAFVAKNKIYVIGSMLDDSEDKSLASFEVYDPCSNQWVNLPYPPIRGMGTKWVGNAVAGGTALLVGIQGGQRHVYCFNSSTRQWTYTVSFLDPLCLHNFPVKIAFVGSNLYGCFHNTVVKLALERDQLRVLGLLLSDINRVDELWDTERVNEFEEQEEEGREEEDEFQQVARLLRNYPGLRMVSKEKGMDAIYNVPQQWQSSTTLLRLGSDDLESDDLESDDFCYVRTGKPPQIHDDEVDDEDIPSNRRRFISVVIFQTAPWETYEKYIARFFRAQYVYSKHYTYYARSAEDLFIKGCYAFGSVRLRGSTN